MTEFRNLSVWRRSKELAVLVYQTSEALPDSEKYGLTTQMRRAAVSVPANIAEGCRRAHRREFHQFLRISVGSLGELETLLEIGADLRLFKNISPMVDECRALTKMIFGLMRRYPIDE